MKALLLISWIAALLNSTFEFDCTLYAHENSLPFPIHIQNVFENKAF